MELTFINEFMIPIVVIACLTVGYVIKNTVPFAKLANDYIPLIVTVSGIVLGVLASGLSLESMVYGAVSGLASTGLHQAFSQLLNLGTKE